MLRECEFGKTVLIWDQLGTSGVCLVRCLLKKFSNYEIYFYCYDDLSLSTDLTGVPDVAVVDFSKNWLGWDDEYPKIDFPKFTKSDKPRLLIVDNLLRLVQFKGMSETCRFVRSVKSEHEMKLISLIHLDVLNDNGTVKRLEYLFDTIISLTACSNDVYASCTMYNKPLGNSIKKVTENIRISDNYEVSVVKEPVKNEGKPVLKDDFTDFQATFNLKLKSSELEAKNKLVLPYISTANELKGKIEYVPDEFDDLYEEDPDDDLDI